jgi:hypothetical protein
VPVQAACHQQARHLSDALLFLDKESTNWCLCCAWLQILYVSCKGWRNLRLLDHARPTVFPQWFDEIEMHYTYLYYFSGYRFI